MHSKTDNPVMDGIITMFERKHMENSNVSAIKNCKTGDVIRFGSYDWFVYARENNIISFDEAIADTFDEFTPVMMKVSVKNGSKFSSFLLITIILFLGSGASLAFAIFKTKVPAKYKHAVPCDQDI